MFEHDQASSCFFVTLVRKFAVVKREKTVLLSQEIGQNFDQVIVLVLIDLSLTRDTPIHENVTLATVSMHITEKDYLILSMVGGDQLFSEVDGRMEQA